MVVQCIILPLDQNKISSWPTLSPTYYSLLSLSLQIDYWIVVSMGMVIANSIWVESPLLLLHWDLRFSFLFIFVFSFSFHVWIVCLIDFSVIESFCEHTEDTWEAWRRRIRKVLQPAGARRSKNRLVLIVFVLRRVWFRGKYYETKEILESFVWAWSNVFPGI